MTIKIKKTPVKMFVVIAVFLFACGSGKQPPTLTIIQAEHTSTVTTPDTVSESSEANDDETVDVVTKTASESSENNTDERPRNTKYADADGNPIYEFVDVHGRIHTLDYPDVDVKPLFNGKNGEEEFRKYLNENNKFQEIADENGIQKVSFFYQFFIDRDGSVVEATIKERESSQPLFNTEMLRLINDTQGKWTPGKHDGETMKVRMISLITFTSK